MKKIMFNDAFLLTKAVLEGRKTQTRRIITTPRMFKGNYVAGFHVYKRQSDGFISEICMYDDYERDFDEGQIVPKYRVGEIVAVAQSYKSIDDFYKAAFSYNHSVHGMTICEFDCISDYDVSKWNMVAVNYRDKRIWTNKLYVKPELMVHFIRITNIRIEKLQDISDEDCLAEGIERMPDGSGFKPYAFYDTTIKVKSRKEGVNYGWYRSYDTPREAYAALIDKVSGKGTWQNNPYVFVYDFELVK